MISVLIVCDAFAVLRASCRQLPLFCCSAAVATASAVVAATVAATASAVVASIIAYCIPSSCAASAHAALCKFFSPPFKSSAYYC
jgi:hypothetical protein